ncbi:transposase [Streptomyces javensis]
MPHTEEGRPEEWRPGRRAVVVTTTLAGIGTAIGAGGGTAHARDTAPARAAERTSRSKRLEVRVDPEFPRIVSYTVSASAPKARCWSTDPGRRHAAGMPDEVQFATKSCLAGEMIAVALDAGITASWVTGDEVYGQDPQLRAALDVIVLSPPAVTAARLLHWST